MPFSGLAASNNQSSCDDHALLLEQSDEKTPW